MALFSKNKKKEEANNIFNLKEYNRKQLKNQDLLFIVVAIIVIIALIGFVVFFIKTVITQINFVFQNVSNSTTKIEGFNMKGFSEIKDKINPEFQDLENQLQELIENATNTLESTSSLNLQLETSTPTSTLENDNKVENVASSTTSSEQIPNNSNSFKITPSSKPSPTIKNNIESSSTSSEINSPSISPAI